MRSSIFGQVKLSICVLTIPIAISACLTAGTHGSIISYQYPLPKNILEKAVNKIIADNPNIKRDSIVDYYNDGIDYYSMEISKDALVNRYTIRLYGGREDWDSTLTSEISIAYAFDKEARGGSAGDGGVAWYKFRLKQKLVGLFKSEFIEKVDKELGIKHIVVD